MPCDLAIDCGSGGTRAFHWSADEGLVRLKWPRGAKAPVLSAVLPSESSRHEFVDDVKQLALEGKSVFIGATAGLRYAMEKGDVNVSDVDAFRQLLPAGSEFHIITPLEEAEYEYRALIAKCSDASVAMVSMGGKSMQLGRSSSLFSLPFAMHLGFHELQGSQLPWQETIASVAALYDSRCLEAKTDPNFCLLDGVVVGVTDTIDVAADLQLLDKKITTSAFVQALECCISEYSAREKASLARVDFVLLARSLLLRAVVNHFFAPSCEVIFKYDWQVNWAAGYFLEARL